MTAPAEEPKTDAVEGEVVPATPVAEIITAPPEDQKLQMIQSRDHPHYGELGWLEKDTLQHTTGQYYFKLSNCQHGTAGCYVLESDLTKADATLETQENPTKPTEFDPYKYSPVVVEKLTEAIGKSYSVVEACQFAGIHKDTYYKWLKEIPEFEGLMAEAKSRPLKKAKEVLNIALQANDVATAKWLLERRDADFKPKAEIDNNIGIQETRNKIGEFLDERSADDFGEQPTAAAGEADGGEVPQPPTDIS